MNDAASPQTFFDTNALIYLGQFQGLLPMKNLLKPICVKLPMHLDTVMKQLIETKYATIFSLKNIFLKQTIRRYVYITIWRKDMTDHDCMPFHMSETTEQKNIIPEK